MTGLCLLERHAVLEQIGGFDERIGLGFFDDDDVCVRVREAGFRMLVAPDIFVHQFGSRTFAGMGIDCRQQLQENFQRFQEKWGAELSFTFPLTPASRLALAMANNAPIPAISAAGSATIALYYGRNAPGLLGATREPSNIPGFGNEFIFLE